MPVSLTNYNIMEQILAFVLGAVTVFIIWGVVVAFKTASKVKNLEADIENVYSQINSNEELINRRVDQEIDRVNQLHDNSIRHTDSRVDKLDLKIENNKRLLKG